MHQAFLLILVSRVAAEESIKRQLRERLRNSKVIVVLIGEKTKNLYKFVRWEMDQALQLGMPIIAVNINGRRELDPQRCPPIIRHELAIHISFNVAIMQYALENWYETHEAYLIKGEICPYFYQISIYRQLGL